MIDLSVDELIQKIVEKSGLKEKEIRDKIKAKRKELNNLITLEGAAHIIAGELGINLLEGMVEIPRLKLENVIPGMSSLDVVGKITMIFETRSFEKSDGSTGKVASAILTDDTSALRIVFWDHHVDLLEKKDLKEGDIIRIRDGYTKENQNGEAEIHTGNRARIIVNPEDVDPEEFPAAGDLQKKLSELSDGMKSVDVIAKVLRVYDPRDFKRDDGSTGKVANLLIADETKTARLVLWDEDAGLVEKGEINEGDILKVKRGYVRSRLGETEVNVGRYGKVVLNPPDVVLENVAQPEISSAKRMAIKDIKADQKAEIRGSIVRIYDNPTIYEKDGEKRFVVNAVVDDGTNRLHTVFFNKMGEILLSTTVNALSDGDPAEIVREREKILGGKELLIAGNVRKNEQTGRIELIVFDVDLNPDPKVEIERLLKESGSLIGGG